MAVQFPDPSVTPIFVGPNGVTYQWDENDGKWIVKSSGNVVSYVSKTGGDEMEGPLKIKQNPDLGTDDEHAVTYGQFKEVIEELQQKVDELAEIIKGSPAKYTFANNNGQVVSRAGEIGTNSGFWSSVTKFSFGTADSDGTATLSMSNGDIIETYNADEDKTNRYTITNASSAPTVVEVQYISGSLFYSLGMEVEVNIY